MVGTGSVIDILLRSGWRKKLTTLAEVTNRCGRGDSPLVSRSLSGAGWQSWPYNVVVRVAGEMVLKSFTKIGLFKLPFYPQLTSRFTSHVAQLHRRSVVRSPKHTLGTANILTHIHLHPHTHLGQSKCAVNAAPTTRGERGSDGDGERLKSRIIYGHRKTYLFKLSSKPRFTLVGFY